VRREFLERWDLRWLAPLGFENSYEIAVPRRIAEERGLATISDLARSSGDLRAAFGYEFTERPDGLPGLAETYGLTFASVQPMQQAIKYQAAADGEIDVLDVYTTDGRLVIHDLTVLDDDRRFFPPYQAAPLARGATIDAHPEIASALTLLAGALDAETLRALNLRLQEGGEEEPAVARDALAELGLAGAGGEEGSRGGAGGRERESFPAYLWNRRGRLAARTAEHLALSAGALLLGVLAAVPLGLALERRRSAAEGVIRAVGLTQTIPSLALLAFMIPLLGVGTMPALVALWIYSLFPIVRNTYSGVRDADPEAVAAALALGMTPRRALAEIRLPLAAPVIMAGVRTAAVITVGTATLAAFIGAGGLGEPIVTGLQLADVRMILSGAIPAALLALAADVVLGLVERRLRPPGVG
jgi:osmoprotectant transport system permease protein